MRTPRPGAPPAPQDRQDVIEVDHVSVARGGRDVLRDVCLRVRVGELTVLAGANGAGKSTLIEVLAGVLAPSVGTVRRWPGPTAYVPQRAAVPERLPVTVHEVVTMGTWGEAGPWRRVGAGGRRRVREAIELLGLAALERRSYSTLSGGERQRALLAQGLARGAGLLLLDEPTTGLDADTAAHICGALVREVSRGVSVVAVSHDPVLIGLADRVVGLDEGRITSDVLRGAPPAPILGRCSRSPLSWTSAP